MKLQFKNIAIIGLGLIGSSILHALNIKFDKNIKFNYDVEVTEDLKVYIEKWLS